MGEKLTKARLRALNLVGSGVSRISHLKMEGVGRVTIDWLSRRKMIETRFPGAVYITEAGRTALTQGCGRDEDGGGRDG